MKKIKILFIFICMCIFPSIVFAAGSVNVNTFSISMEEGQNGSFTISANNAAGKVTFSSSNDSVASINKSAEWLDNSSTTVTVTGRRAGTASIIVVVDAATYDMEVIQKTYTVNVNVSEKYVDTRDSNNFLNSLEIAGQNINFNKNETNYSINVKNNVKEISISASASSSKAKVTGTGTFQLEDYANSFSITVTAENQTRRTYTIIVNREDKEGNNKKLSIDNTLRELSIEGYEIEFNKNQLEYFINVDNDVDSLVINPVVNDEFAEYKITGNKNFKEGINKVSIIVTSEKGTTKTYNILAYKKENYPEISIEDINQLSDIKEEKIFLNVPSDQMILSKDVLEEIKKQKKTVVINKYNEEGMLTYYWEIDGKNTEGIDKINLKIDFEGENEDKALEKLNYAKSVYLNFKHNGDLPKNTYVTVYVGDKYDDKDKLTLYYYNEKTDKLEISGKEIKVKNGYAQIKIDHCSDYILSKAETVKSNNVLVYVIIIESALLGGLIILDILNKNPLTKNKKTSK